MSDALERLREYKEKNKALRQFLRQSEEDKKKLDSEINDLHIQNQKLSDMLENEVAQR